MKIEKGYGKEKKKQKKQLQINLVQNLVLQGDKENELCRICNTIKNIK